METRFGLTDAQRAALKTEIRVILVAVARAEEVITYHELTARLPSVPLAPDAPALAPILREISVAEDKAGRGLLTAVVVLKGRGLPGKGFFDLARRRDRDTSDPKACWLAECRRVYAAWSGEAG
jgi:hypothetical protein